MPQIAWLSKITIAIGLVLLFGGLWLAVVAFIDNAKSSPRMTCQANLRQVSMAFMQYNADYEYYPPGNNNNQGLESPDNWIGHIYPYIYENDLELFQCPSDGYATDNQKSSYGYNARLGSAKPKVKDDELVILNFEVQADSNNWTQSGTGLTSISANTRHLDGANYSFADGHVKWLKPEQVRNEKPDGKNYTFRLK